MAAAYNQISIKCLVCLLVHIVVVCELVHACICVCDCVSVCTCVSNSRIFKQNLLLLYTLGASAYLCVLVCVCMYGVVFICTYGHLHAETYNYIITHTSFPFCLKSIA